MGARRWQWMPLWSPFATAGEQFIKNTSSCRFKLITRLIYRFVYIPTTAPSTNPCGWPPTRQIGVICLINTVGGETTHHGDDVCGGGCVGAQQVPALFLP